MHNLKGGLTFIIAQFIYLRVRQVFILPHTIYPILLIFSINKYLTYVTINTKLIK